MTRLDAIPVATSPASGYVRSAFGKGWKDPDRNGCDARNDMLARDLSDVEFKPGTRDCVVILGTLNDPYTGAIIAFEKGQGTSELVHIDHVVALSWAWQYGAGEWDAATRELFANDPINLLAVDGAANQSKSDKGPASWLPVRDFHCEYAVMWVDILSTYELAVPLDDRDALRDVLTRCR